MSDRKYFYKLAFLLSEFGELEKKSILNCVFTNFTKTAQLDPLEEDYLEEWNGITDLNGNPFERKKKNRFNSTQISRDPNANYDNTFPLSTLDGESITEKNFRRWVKKEMKEYINAMIENYEWKHGIDDPDQIASYVSQKGWVDFVNKFNPLKFMLVNTGNLKNLSKEYEKRTGKSLKKEYMQLSKRLLNKRRNNFSKED